MDLHSLEALPPSPHSTDCLNSTQTSECHFSTMKDRNKELWTASVECNNRIYYIYNSKLAESFLVLTFNCLKNSTLESIQKAFFRRFSVVFFQE